MIRGAKSMLNSMDRFPSMDNSSAAILMCPDEVLLQILLYVDPLDKISFGCVSRRCHAVAHDTSHWMHYCQKFKYWPKEMHQYLDHRKINELCKKNAVKRQLDYELANRKFEALLDGGEEDKILMDISSGGYAVKDFLIDQRLTADDDPKVLCRRWWAQEALNTVHRRIILDEWAKTMNSDPPSRTLLNEGYKKYRLEHFLSVLGMAMFQQPDDDMEFLSARLDNIANDFRVNYPGWMEQSSPVRAIAMILWFHHVVLHLPEHSQGDNLEYKIPNLGYAPFGQSVGILKSADNGVVRMFHAAVFVALAQRLDIPVYFTSLAEHVIIPVGAGDIPAEYFPVTAVDDNVACFILHPGTSDKCEVAPAPINIHNELKVITEDEFVVNLLTTLWEWLSDSDYGQADALASQVFFVAKHLAKCGEVLMAPLADSKYDFEYAFSEPAHGIDCGGDAQLIRQYVQHWIDTRGPPGFADTNMAQELMDILRLNISTYHKVLCGPQQCGRDCDGTGCTKCPRFRAGDVVSLPSEFHGGFVPLDQSIVVGMVVDRYSLPVPHGAVPNYNYSCLFSSFPVELFNFEHNTAHETKLVSCPEALLSCVHDPSLIPDDVFFHAGFYSLRFDDKNCRFIPNCWSQFSPA